MNRATISLTIPPEQWQNDGPPEDDALRLIGPPLEINGVYFHVHAHRCEQDERDMQRFVQHQWTRDAETAAYLLNDQAVSTMDIRGEPYIVLIYPYGV